MVPDPQPPDVGILVCGHIDETMQPLAGGDYPAIYTALLHSADPTLTVRSYAALDGDLPDRPDACRSWIITGSPHDAFADDPWIVALREFVAETVAAGARVVGICFGHQLVAEALGGRVERSDRWAAGPHEMTVEATPWFAGGTVAVNAMHRDVVTALPGGGRTIATGSTAEIPAFTVGDTVLCLQDHPEFNGDVTRALIERRRDRMGDEVADAALATLDGRATDGTTVARWIVDFLLDRRGD